MLKRIERCCKFSDIFMARGGKVFLEGLVKDFIDALDTTPAGSNDLEDEVCCNEKKIEMLASLIEVAAGLHLEEHLEKACENILANKTRFDLQLVVAPLLCELLQTPDVASLGALHVLASAAASSFTAESAHTSRILLELLELVGGSLIPKKTAGLFITHLKLSVVPSAQVAPLMLRNLMQHGCEGDVGRALEHAVEVNCVINESSASCCWQILETLLLHVAAAAASAPSPWPPAPPGGTAVPAFGRMPATDMMELDVDKVSCNDTDCDTLMSKCRWGFSIELPFSTHSLQVISITVTPPFCIVNSFYRNFNSLVYRLYVPALRRPSSPRVSQPNFHAHLRTDVSIS
jgi:hypothetical protein